MISDSKWREISPKLQVDIENAISIWSEILYEYGCVLAYVKGSALKQWNGPIDFVPVISDIDIHYQVAEDKPEMDSTIAMELAGLYQERFFNQHPDAFHLPRLQLIDTKDLYKNEFAIPPLENQVKLLFGKNFLKTSDELASEEYFEKIRQIDRSKLSEVVEILEKLPGWLLDRNHDMELWSIVRRLCWRISPIASRILTQIENNPLDVWGWNRSTSLQKLRQNSSSNSSELHQKIITFTHLFKEYYMAGWKLYLHNFSGFEAYQNVIAAAVKVLEIAGEIRFLL